jgi:hypothetical protein
MAATSPSGARGAPAEREAVRGVRRRAFLGGAAALAGLGLSGCGSTAAALLRAAAAPIDLIWRPWYSFPNGQGPAAASLMMQGIAPWLEANPGVRVHLTTLGYQQDTVAAMLAGNGPDVFEDWVLPLYVQKNLVLDLAPYVREMGVPLAAYAPAVIGYMLAGGRYAPGGPGLYSLPAYTHTVAAAVNEGLLGELGLRLPEPDWDAGAWTRLWEQATRRSTDAARQRYGGQLYWSGYDYTMGNPAPFYLRGYGGEYVDPLDNTRCALTEPGSLQCLRWAYQLQADGVIGGHALNDFTAQRLATSLIGTDGTLPEAAAAWQSLRWNLYPMPVWPRGRLTFASSDFYAIWAGTAHPDLAWDFVHFLCVEPTWQRWMMKLALVGPNQPAMFPEWARIVREVAPPLRRKRLEVITEAMQDGTAYVGASFRYEEVASAGVISRYSSLAQSGHLSVATAARQATREVNALQAGGAAAEAAAVARIEAIEEVALSPTPLVLPLPPVSGSGTPARPSPYVRRAGGRFTLLGDGTRCGGTADNAVFWATGARGSQARFVCRLLALGNVSGPGMSPTAEAGLMARADLADAAACVALGLTAGNGMVLRSRTSGGEAAKAYGPPETASPAGLIGAPYLTGSLDVWSSNYVLQPVWLRLDREGLRWTAYTSLDGRHWAQAGPPQEVEMAAVWVGLYACAGNAVYAGRYYVNASFDHLSFVPGSGYQLGASGVVPQAGPVPPDWSGA